MKATFWHQKWDKGEIGFHEAEVNALLVDHVEALNLTSGARLFLPLCGKTRDIAWLLGGGYRVVGAELSELAIKALFLELGVEPIVSKVDKLTLYSATDIDIFVGDIFDVTSELIGHIDAVYDRAALVALPKDMREQYASHVMHITDTAPQLLIALNYDPQHMEGPPFSIGETDVKTLYQGTYRVSSMESREVVGGFKGKLPATEVVWLLEKDN